MPLNIETYILYSSLEEDRIESIELLKKQFNHTNHIEAIFPKLIRVPFLDRIIQVSKERTGNALSSSEIGCLLGHRKIWSSIVAKNCSEDQHFLVLESDSILNDSIQLNKLYDLIQTNYDLFFWGAWNGFVRIRRSTIIKEEHNMQIGEPFLKSVYCTYGYSLNKRAARYLLKQTKHVAYPVDMFKHYVQLKDLRVGAIRKELISTPLYLKSYIRNNTQFNFYKRRLITRIFDLRNALIAYFS